VALDLSMDDLVVRCALAPTAQSAAQPAA